MKQEIDDYLFHLKDELELDLSYELMNEILEKVVEIAKRRYD